MQRQSLSLFIKISIDVCSCGGDTEQKVNGVISYMPITTAGYGPTPKMEIRSDEPKKPRGFWVRPY